MTGGGALAPDLSLWSTWWEHNKAPYLALKAHVHSPGTVTGTDGWFLSDVEETDQPTLQPSEDEVRERILPSLLRVLEEEKSNDLVTGALIALAKIGGAGSLEDARRSEAAIVRFLADANQEIRETAAIALGILAQPRAIPLLANLLWDTAQGRELVKRGEVDYRARAFAAYGLGLIGARTESETDRRIIVSALRRALETDATSTRDVAVACVVAFSIVPLAPLPEGDDDLEQAADAPPESSRQAQLEFLLALLGDRDRHVLVRAQCPIALARLLADLPAESREPLRARVADELCDLVQRNRELVELVQSAILALGQIGTNDGENALDGRIRATLMGALDGVKDTQSRGFVLIALAQSGGRAGDDPSAGGLARTAEFLIEQVTDGRSMLRAWAGLACGVLGHELARSQTAAATLERLQRAVRAQLVDEKDPDRVGAYATAAGLLRDSASAPALDELLAGDLEDETRGRVAIGLALMGHRDSLGTLRATIERSAYRPHLLHQCAIAQALLRDKQAVPALALLLDQATSLASQASITIALGSIGDRRSIDPLLATLGKRALTERARAFVAVALGNVADKEALPWNSKLALGLNYRASTATLTEPASATGILDIL